jgi:hypothetical protein
LLKYDRFRQKAVQDAAGAAWEIDAAFQLEHHVVPTKLAREKGQSERAALQALCGELATTPLDHTRPLWQFHFIVITKAAARCWCASTTASATASPSLRW